jgi:hypothetical protein
MNERTDRYLLCTRKMADAIGSMFEIDLGPITARSRWSKRSRVL